MHRRQRTLRQTASISGFGLFSGGDCTVHFHPAEPDSGIVFRRVDLAEKTHIPARLEYVVPRPRRTAISHQGATVETIEHVMAALAGLQIDNCLVELDAPEPPGVDGSSLPFVQELLAAGLVEQDACQPLLVIQQEVSTSNEAQSSQILAGPIPQRKLALTYELDYGPRSPIRPQLMTIEFSPELFITNLAFARTFVLEQEVAELRKLGYGRRVTEKDVLIFGSDGPIGNTLRAPDECVRHKLLDCLGDFALLGCDVHGHFRAHRSGHAMNHDICRRIRQSHGFANGLEPINSSRNAELPPVTRSLPTFGRPAAIKDETRAA